MSSRIVSLFSLSSALFSLVCICILSFNVSSIADLDILYTSLNSEFVFTNITGKVETVRCEDVSQCLHQLEEISKRAKNVVSFSSIYNFTQTPFSSISHYTRTTIFICLSFSVILFISSLSVFVLMYRIEKVVFF